jgi:hypothetical protein
MQLAWLQTRSRCFVDLDIRRVTDSARAGSSLAGNASNSPQRHSNKPSGAPAVPTAAVADPHGPPPLSVKPGATTSRSRGRRCSLLAWVISAIVVLLVAGAALGVGLGLGLRSGSPAASFGQGAAGNATVVTPHPTQQQPGTAALAPLDAPAALSTAPPVGTHTDVPTAPTSNIPVGCRTLTDRSRCSHLY